MFGIPLTQNLPDFKGHLKQKLDSLYLSFTFGGLGSTSQNYTFPIIPVFSQFPICFKVVL